MKNHMLRLALIVIASFSLSSVIPAGASQQPQDAAQQDQAVQLKVRLIQLSALVRNNKGEIVDGLAKDDFELQENGKLQEIRFFSVVRTQDDRGLSPNAQPTAAAETSAPGKPVSELPPSRVIVMFVDTLHMQPSNVLLAKEAMLKFVKTQMTVGDIAAIITSSGSLGLYQQFTRDRTALSRAIQKVTPIPPMMLIPSGGNLSHDYLDLDYFRRSTLSVLRAVIDSMARMPGQRLIVLFSDGFSATASGEIFNGGDLRVTISRATRAGIIVHAIDAKGLEAPDMPLPQLRMLSSRGAVGASNNQMIYRRTDVREDDLNALAKDTGGDFFRNVNDFSGSIRRVLDSSRVYYQLAYYMPDDEDQKKFRRISLRIKGHSEYKVRTQLGYSPVDLGDTHVVASGRTAQQKFFAAMAEPLPRTELGVIATAQYMESSSDTFQASLKVHLDGGSLSYQEENGQNPVELEIGAIVLDQRGRLVATYSDTMTGKVASSDLEAVKRNGYTYGKRLAINPGAYQLRVGVREASTGRVGTAAAWVEVPALKDGRHYPSDILLLGGAAQSGGELKPKLSTGRFLDQRDWQGPAVVPPQGSLVYHQMIYCEGDDKDCDSSTLVRWEIWRDEKMVANGEWQGVASLIVGRDGKGVELAARVDANLEAGEYEFRMLLKDSKWKKPVTRFTTFTVSSDK